MTTSTQSAGLKRSLTVARHARVLDLRALAAREVDMSLVSLRIVSTLVLSGAASACTVTDPPVVVCPTSDTVSDDPGPAPDPCASGRTLLTRVYTREHGMPELDRTSFVTPRDGALCVVVSSPAPDGDTPTASASISLDDTEVVREAAFAHHPRQLTRTMDARSGLHELAVRPRSSPGATLRVEVRFAAPRGPAEIAQAHAVAELEVASCQELNQVLEAAGPNETARVLYDYAALGGVAGRLLVDTNAHGVPALLAPLAAEDLGQHTDPAVRAAVWMDRHRALFRWTDPDISLEALPALSLPGGAHRVTLEERWRGIPVRGARVVLISDATGAVRAFGGNFVPEIADAGPAVVTAAQAEQLAQRATNSEVLAPATAEILDLGALGRPAAPLTWSVETSGGVVWVDAHTAEVLHVGEAPGFDVTVFDRGLSEDPVTGTPLDRRIQFDTSGRFTSTARCGADCVAATVFAGEADDFFENGMGRVGGWSGEGNGLSGGDAIGAAAPYDIEIGDGLSRSRFERRLEEDLRLLDSAGDVRTDATIGPWTVLQPADVSRDGVVHEFGHGALAVDLQMRRTDTMMSCGARGVAEHVGDTFAMLADAATAEPVERQLCVAGRDGTCRRYHGRAQPSGSRCGAFGHLTDVDDGLNALDPGCDDSLYHQGCVASRIYGLGLESAGTAASEPYHGVTVLGASLAESKGLFDTTVRSALRIETDLLGYGFAHQMTAFGVLATCATRTCEPELAERFATPFWASGLWSAEQVLGPGLDSTFGPAALSAGGQTWVFFVPPASEGGLIAGELAAYTDANILDDVPGVAFPMRTILTGEALRPVTDLAAASAGGLLTVLVGEGPDTATLLWSATDGATWDQVTVPLRGGRVARGSLSVAHLGGQLLIAYENTSGSLSLLDVPFPPSGTPRAPTDVLTPGLSSPALLAVDGAHFELWARAAGQLRVGQGHLGAGGAAVFDRVLDYTVSRLATTSVPDGGGHEGGGTVVTRFLGRPQFYVQRGAGGVSAAAFDAETQVEPRPAFFRLRSQWGGRPATVNVVDPATGMPVHVLISVGSEARGLPRRLVFSQKRSD
jgi:hypothetical protein